jgi:kynureninase
VSDLDTVFAATRELFDIPDDVIYLDGNSLGPLMHGVRERVAHEIDEHWQADLIKAWNTADWIDLPARVGDRIGRLIGAPAESVIAADSTSVNLFKVLTAALDLATDGRKVVLSDTGNFPTDLYVAQGVAGLLGSGIELRTVEPDAVADSIDESVAVLMLTQVDYRTGRKHDMAELTRRAHEEGALTVWDLAHSAGALPIDLVAADADFAVGCGYKYLNGGPGAPSFVYVRSDLAQRVRPAIAGWLGHAEPFAFDAEYRPAPGIDRMRVGTPPILSMVALDAALDVWDEVSVEDVRARSIELCELFIAEVEARCGAEVELASPRDPQRRGSQVSFRHAEGYAVMQALIARDVIGDFRMPDLMRFGFAPLYVRPADVIRAAEILDEVLGGRLWDAPEYMSRRKVT